MVVFKIYKGSSDDYCAACFPILSLFLHDAIAVLNRYDKGVACAINHLKVPKMDGGKKLSRSTVMHTKEADRINSSVEAEK